MGRPEERAGRPLPIQTWAKAIRFPAAMSRCRGDTGTHTPSAHSLGFFSVHTVLDVRAAPTVPQSSWRAAVTRRQYLRVLSVAVDARRYRDGSARTCFAPVPETWPGPPEITLPLMS